MRFPELAVHTRACAEVLALLLAPGPQGVRVGRRRAGGGPFVARGLL